MVEVTDNEIASGHGYYSIPSEVEDAFASVAASGAQVKISPVDLMQLRNSLGITHNSLLHLIVVLQNLILGDQDQALQHLEKAWNDANRGYSASERFFAEIMQSYLGRQTHE